MSQALKYYVINICQNVLAILCHVLLVGKPIF